MNDTVSFLLEGLRGRDCQGISLDDPLDTAMMVLSGVAEPCWKLFSTCDSGLTCITPAEGCFTLCRSAAELPCLVLAV
jgi:hypothetical protein